MYYHFINSEYPNGCVRESKVEKPDVSVWDYALPFSDKCKPLYDWVNQLSPPIKCTSPLGENGQRVEEGKDFVFDDRLFDEQGFPYPEPTRVAVPLKKDEDAEGLWDEAWDNCRLIGTDIDDLQYYAGREVMTKPDFEKLKSKFTITRKVNQ